MKLYFVFIFFVFIIPGAKSQKLSLNDQEYFEMPGLNVMAFHDYYPEGHQGGVSIILNGERIASNGDLRLEPAPGQWQPVPKLGERQVDSATQTITANLAYPDSSKHLKGFNPIVYPDLQFSYQIRVQAREQSVLISVDLDSPLPEKWIGKVGFNLELFPGLYFGKSYIMDGEQGIFPRQFNGPLAKDSEGIYQAVPLATGKHLAIAPETSDLFTEITGLNRDLELLDGRVHHNNGWFIIRSTVPSGATKNAIQWRVTPHAIPGWKYDPVVHVSQVGYHPAQPKVAVIEIDKRDTFDQTAQLTQIHPDGSESIALKQKPRLWGRFLRYHYAQFDFTAIKEFGLYVIEYDKDRSEPFQISPAVYDRHVWQPTLEYFLPVQMCHMRVQDRYRVWHGLCHMDDALMAPTDSIHFDGYRQGPSTLTTFESGEHVPGVDQGGWHDAGDYDLRVESQAGTVYILSLAYEEFNIHHDETSINQATHLVELHRPDGEPDILQQIEHGVLTILGGYRAMGRLYRGIICPYLRQYVLLGDASTMTDNRIYDPQDADTDLPLYRAYGRKDDRLVFTEENPRRELGVVAALAAAARALKEFRPGLAQECLETAEVLYSRVSEDAGSAKLNAAAELYITTGKDQYRTFLQENVNELTRNVNRSARVIGRVAEKIKDDRFNTAVTQAVEEYHRKIETQKQENPFGVPYRPNIWGAGWTIQSFGVDQYFLHTRFPNIFSNETMLNALNFVLGVHPGSNTVSFASGVGSNSLLVAYGTNRHEWSFIPGGVGSGTGIIRPDFPELKEWPYFWQQSEYVMGGGGSNFMFLALAAQHLLAKD
jgi:hypothetical protein